MVEDRKGIYRHFKGNYYEVVGTAIDVDTNEELVLYRQMYDVFGYWMRPVDMFFGERMTEDGPVKRFKKIGISFEDILSKENIVDLTPGHSETQKFYKIENYDLEKSMFYVKAI